MAKKLNKLQPNPDFKPDEDLIEMAKSFSENYKNLSPGIYESDNKKYVINYIKNPEQNFKTARVNSKTGEIEINFNVKEDEKISAIDINFWIIWSAYSFHNTGLYDYTDILATKYFLKKGVSKKVLSSVFLNLFSKSPSDLNVARFKNIKKELDK